ncbi:MAG: iron-containing redox enzyme family protein [Jatrophihabitantaceae bacterium]
MTTTSNGSGHAIDQQSQSTIADHRNSRATADRTALYAHPWPPVQRFAGFAEDFSRFLAAQPSEQARALAALRDEPDRHSKFLHESLAEVYAHWFGYRDGAYIQHDDDAGELALYQAKLNLERDLFEHWARPARQPELTDQSAAADFLDQQAARNPGVHHPLFDFLATEATAEQLTRFLQCEVIRNEVVDDEVALLVVGLQGMQKAVVAANLWDECGRGRLENFHTYWLRRLLTATNGWQALAEFREGQQPWFSRITSNVFSAVLTRPSRTMLAYGCFLIFEGWVEPHFRKILQGLDRVGMTDDDIGVYFSAHVKIDPRHSQELSDGLRGQLPELEPDQVAAVVQGALLAVDAGTRQFDAMLAYLTRLSGTPSAQRTLSAADAGG